MPARVKPFRSAGTWTAAVVLGLWAFVAPGPGLRAQTTPEIIDSTGIAGPIDDYTTHTYSVRAGGRGSFADRMIVRRFAQPVKSLKLTIVAGQADDIGYVGSRLVTNARGYCEGLGSVQSPVDVTDQVTIDGNQASFLLRAQENCCCVTGWGSATQYDRTDAKFHWEVTFGGPKIEITLDPEPPDQRYVVTTTPTMPQVRATAKVVGVSPDPTPTTVFTWHASLAVDERYPPEEVKFDDDIVQDTTTTGEAPYLLELEKRSAIRGGRLKLTATASIDGQEMAGETEDGLRIEGKNPLRSDVRSAIDSGVSGGIRGLSATDTANALKRVACQEYHQFQFEPKAEGGIGPVEVSFDDGVGIFQITRTNRCYDPFIDCPQVLYDWRANVTEGIANFRDKVPSARQYPAKLRGKSSTYPDFIKGTINPIRKEAGLRPIPGIPAPQFTTTGLLGADEPNQLLEDSIRGINGFAGDRLYGLHLHEFRPDVAFLEKVPDADLPKLNHDQRVWERVPLTDRPEVGRDYVVKVTSWTTTCIKRASRARRTHR